jgi:hypothetical protein
MSKRSARDRGRERMVRPEGGQTVDAGGVVAADATGEIRVGASGVQAVEHRPFVDEFEIVRD